MNSNPRTIHQELQPLNQRPIILIGNLNSNSNYPITQVGASAPIISAKEQFRQRIKKHYPSTELLILSSPYFLSNLSIILLELSFETVARVNNYYKIDVQLCPLIIMACFINLLYSLVTILSSNFIIIRILLAFLILLKKLIILVFTLTNSNNVY
jgi:hypothetical protein